MLNCPSEEGDLVTVVEAVDVESWMKLKGVRLSSACCGLERVFGVDWNGTIVDLVQHGQVGVSSMQFKGSPTQVFKYPIKASPFLPHP